MQYDYFYNQEVEQYVHFQMPTALFEYDNLNKLSINAKFMYCLLFERAKLSFKNNIVDENGRVYIHFAQSDLKELLNCGRTKITDYFNELDEAKGGVGLIERKQKNGIGKSDIIYVKNFAKSLNEDISDDIPETGSFSFFHNMGGMRFNFYRVPKVLFVDEKIKTISNIAKMAYVFMLNRTSLSKSNGWIDGNGRIYIIFPQKELQEILKCSKMTMNAAYNELEKIHLIERKKQNMNKPDIIYVLDYSTNLKYQTNCSKSVDNISSSNLVNIGGIKSEHREVQNMNIGGIKSEHREVQNLNIGGTKSEHDTIRNINNSNIDFNHIHFSHAANDGMNENHNNENKKLKLSYSDMLFEIGYKCHRMPDEDEEYEPFPELLKECHIPYFFSANIKNTEMALKFIFGYNFYINELNEINSNFFKDVIKNLAEMIAKPDGKINPNEVIDRLNDIISSYYSPYDWFLTLIDNWTSVIKSKNEYGERIKFPDKLLKKVMFNWLKNYNLDEDCLLRTIPEYPLSSGNDYKSEKNIPSENTFSFSNEPIYEEEPTQNEKNDECDEADTPTANNNMTDNELNNLLKNGKTFQDLCSVFLNHQKTLSEKIEWFDENIENWRENADIHFMLSIIRADEQEAKRETSNSYVAEGTEDNTEELRIEALKKLKSTY